MSLETQKQIDGMSDIVPVPVKKNDEDHLQFQERVAEVKDPFDGMSDEQIVQDQQDRVKNYIQSERYKRILSNEYYMNHIVEKNPQLLVSEVDDIFSGYPGKTVLNRSLQEISYKQGGESFIVMNKSLLTTISSYDLTDTDYLEKLKSIDEKVGYKTFVSKLATDIISDPSVDEENKKAKFSSYLEDILTLYKELLVQSGEIESLIDQQPLWGPIELSIKERLENIDLGYEILKVKNSLYPGFHIRRSGEPDPYLTDENSMNQIVFGDLASNLTSINVAKIPGKVYLGQDFSSSNIFAPVHEFMHQAVDQSGLLYKSTKMKLSDGVFNKDSWIHLLGKNANQDGINYTNDLREVYANLGTLKYVLHKFKIVDVYESKISYTHILSLQSIIKDMADGRTKKSLNILMDTINILFGSPTKEGNNISNSIDLFHLTDVLNSVAMNDNPKTNTTIS